MSNISDGTSYELLKKQVLRN